MCHLKLQVGSHAQHRGLMHASFFKFVNNCDKVRVKVRVVVAEVAGKLGNSWSNPF